MSDVATVEAGEAGEPHSFKVGVIYDGVEKPFEVHRHELVKKLRADAITAFGITQNPHLLGLFTKENKELNDEQTIQQAGVKPHEKLLLRPSHVRSGGR